MFAEALQVFWTVWTSMVKCKCLILTKFKCHFKVLLPYIHEYSLKHCLWVLQSLSSILYIKFNVRKNDFNTPQLSLVLEQYSQSSSIEMNVMNNPFFLQKDNLHVTFFYEHRLFIFEYLTCLSFKSEPFS